MYNLRKVLLVSALMALAASLLPPAVTPVFAASSHIWTTEADFEAGTLDNVDTASSPGDVLLASNVDTGTGTFDFLDVDNTVYTDSRKAAVALVSQAGQNKLYANTASGPFYAGDEVLIIQMTGTGAGRWETRHVQSVSPTQITLTENLQNTYYADTISKAQVIMIPQWKDVTVKNGGNLTCDAWNGSTGGIVFFRSTGTVTIEQGGSIDVSAKGFGGGTGGSGGSGGQGGNGGDGHYYYKSGDSGGISGTSGHGGSSVCDCGKGGNGALQGYNGSYGNDGDDGGGPAGGASGHGGNNSSSNDLSSLQLGSGGGGGSGGRGGYGGGGQGGGGGSDATGGTKGLSGSQGGDGGSGGNGGQGAGAIIIYAKNIVTNAFVRANGSSGTPGIIGSAGNSDNSTLYGAGGGGFLICGGSGGGGGGGSQGGGGGAGAGGGAGGTIWLVADNLTLGNSLVTAAIEGTNALGGVGGSGGTGQDGGEGGGMDLREPWCAGNDGSDGHNGPSGLPGAAGHKGGTGKIRLDYVTLSGSTNPNPSYQSGVYVPEGTIASDVLDNGVADTPWQVLQWLETVHNKTDISFEVRASNTAFTKDAASPAWVSAGSSSPVTTGLPSGRYMQWRATLTAENNTSTPVLHQVTVQYTNAPVVETVSATSISTTSATLNGNLVAFNPAPNAEVSFEYGSAPGDYSWETTVQQMSSTGAFQANLSGLLNGTTYYYRAKATSTGWGTGYGEEKHFTTATPSVLTTNGPSHVTISSACLNGTINYYPSEWMKVYFNWGTDPSRLNNKTPDQYNVPYFNQTINGLAAGTKYYFRAEGYDDEGYYHGSTLSFTTTGTSPAVSTGDATSITASSATLNGSLAYLGSASTVNVSFQYGTTHGGPYPNSTSAQALTARGSFNAGITGLTTNTTYYYRAVGDGGAYGTGYGNEISFTTSGIPPEVITSGATAITSSSATLNGQISDMGSSSTVNACFEWGTDQDNLNASTGSQPLSIASGFSADLSLLDPNTTYYFRAKGDGGISGTGYGDIMFFTTAKVPPVVSTSGATDVTTDSATLNGTLNNLGSANSVNVTFQYGTTSGIYNNQTTPQAMTATGDFNAFIGGLSAATTYYYRARAVGDGTSYGTEHVFTTGNLPPSVTTDNASDMTSNSALLNGTLPSLGTATTVNVSFQYGTTQGGPYSSSTSSQARTSTGAFQISLGSLDSGTTYYFRARADGGASGTAYGDEKSFRTGKFPPYVETSPATGISDTGATLNGNLRLLGSASTVNVYFQYGTTSGGPYPNSTPQQAMTATGIFQADLSTLTPATTYYFCATGNGGTYGTSTGAEMSFTTSKLPPSVTTVAASDILSGNATLNGILDSLGDASSVNVSFQWSKQSGGPYTYSTPAQTLTTPESFHAAIGGLHGNTTYYFRAKGDGGIYGTAYGSELNFTTAMIPPTVETDNATSVAATSASLNGFLNSPGTAGSVNTWFEYGVTQGGPYSTSTPIQAMSSRGFLQAKISGLSALTTYYFIARADAGAHGSASGQECSFTTSATPPSVSTAGATSVSADTATLNGCLHDLGTAPNVNVAFQYGTTSGVYNEETPQQTLSAPADFTANLASLHPDITYYYRAIADGGDHGTSYGSEHAFTTNALPPTVTTAAATDMTTDFARLNGTLNNLGTATSVNVSFVYGTTAGGPYPNSTSTSSLTATGDFNIFINGLSPSTTYYFKARADGGKYGAAYGSELNFTTSHLPPVMWTESATDVMTNAATLNGEMYLPGSSTNVDASFEWGTTQGGPYPNITPSQSLATPDPYLYDLTGLSPDTTYYFRSRGDGGASGIGYGEEQAFTTSSHPPVVDTSDAGSLTSTSAVLNGSLLSLGSATTVNVSFVWGTTQGGPYPNPTTPGARSSTGSFSSSISGLTSLTVYYFRSKADGGIYGVDYGQEMSFITPTIPPSVTTNNATNVTSNSATLNGNLSSMGRASSVNVSFVWGTKKGGPYPSSIPAGSKSGPASFWANLNNLSADKTYYFIAKADGGPAGTSYGSELAFTTQPDNPITPTFSMITTTPSHGSGQVSSPANTPPPPVWLSNIVVSSASLSAEKVTPGTPVEVSATLVNQGQVKGKASICLYINGQVDSAQGVTLESGQSRLITFTSIQNQPGTYFVYINSFPVGSFTVGHSINPRMILLVSLLMFSVSFVLAVIYIFRRRKEVTRDE